MLKAAWPRRVGRGSPHVAAGCQRHARCPAIVVRPCARRAVPVRRGDTGGPPQRPALPACLRCALGSALHVRRRADRALRRSCPAGRVGHPRRDRRPGAGRRRHRRRGVLLWPNAADRCGGPRDGASRPRRAPTHRALRAGVAVRLRGSRIVRGGARAPGASSTSHQSRPCSTLCAQPV